MKKTKIICTIGPASLSRTTLEKMHCAGMSCARISTACVTIDQYKKMISDFREVADIPIITNIKEPEIRLKAEGKRAVNKGDVPKVAWDGKIS